MAGNFVLFYVPHTRQICANSLSLADFVHRQRGEIQVVDKNASYDQRAEIANIILNTPRFVATIANNIISSI